MPKTLKMFVLKQIIRHHSNNTPIKAIARHCGVSRNTVKHYLKLLEESKVPYSELLSMEDHELGQLLTQGKSPNERHDELIAQMPYFTQELRRTGVNRQVLWNEYKEQHPDGYQYTRFCHHLDQWQSSAEATLHIEQKPGDKLYIDFCGKQLEWEDRTTGKKHPVEVFIAVLGYSNHTYVEACASQKQADMIGALVNALHFFGGVPRAIVPDNMKTAVIKASKYEPTLNEALNQLANHYGTVILPARSRKPRDKAWVEQGVKTIYSRIYAPLRNRTFYSLSSLNEAIGQALQAHNETLLQGRDYSRLDRFAEEKKELSDLPSTRFEIKKRSLLTVMQNCHIRLNEDKHYYSVPYRYIGKRVQVEYTRDAVSIYANFDRIAYHVRNYKMHGYSTQEAHLPSHHRYVSSWSVEKFLGQAEAIGPHTKGYFKELIKRKAYPEQAYRSCAGILSLAKKVGKDRMEHACERAAYYEAYHYKTIEGILNKALDTYYPCVEELLGTSLPSHNNIRGAEAYE